MNKLVIVGNGFDLAHGLRTSYKDYIDNFWTTLELKHEDPIIKRMVNVNASYCGFFNYGGKPSSYFDLKNQMKKYAENYGFTFSEENNMLIIKRPNRVVLFEFVNEFFKIITLEAIENWVDIENLYYEILKDLVKKNIQGNSRKYPFSIDQLNEEFEDVKQTLEEYLRQEVTSKYDFRAEPSNIESMLNLFKISPLYLDLYKEHPIFSEYQTEDHQDLIDFDKKVVEIFDLEHTIIKLGDWPHSLFLDFNYTRSAENYVKQINLRNKKDYGTASLIQIHGRIGCTENKINFGFGDEMDDDYKIIENAANNSYLKNIKSFQYLHTSNYRKLLNWIETNKFQVYIFGHSCGLSDRTLLNTIFENDNCRSIKIFFHENKKYNNYTELTQNISRHFNKKALMRKKIVDKTLCSPLIQEVRFKSK